MNGDVAVLIEYMGRSWMPPEVKESYDRVRNVCRHPDPLLARVQGTMQGYRVDPSTAPFVALLTDVAGRLRGAAV